MASNKRSRSKVRARTPKRRSAVLAVLMTLLVGLVYHVVTRESGNMLPNSAQQQLGAMRLEGTGGDPDLNRQKNRRTPPSAFEDMTPQHVVDIPDKLLLDAGRKMRRKWSAQTLGYLAQQESRSVRVTGYLVAAKESGVESCNGFVDSLRDYHIWIGDLPTATKPSSIVVEVTPYWKTVHPDWRLRFFTALARQHAKVRVTGWLMWDEEHPNEVGHSRSTCWEVHPITRFEIWSGGVWTELSADYAAK